MYVTLSPTLQNGFIFLSSLSRQGVGTVLEIRATADVGCGRDKCEQLPDRFQKDGPTPPLDCETAQKRTASGEKSPETARINLEETESVFSRSDECQVRSFQSGTRSSRGCARPCAAARRHAGKREKQERGDVDLSAGERGRDAEEEDRD